MRKFLFLLLLAAAFSPAPAQNPASTPAHNQAPVHHGPKPYREVITEKAITHPGLFTIHKVADKWYFEIPDSIFGRDILVSTRYIKTPAGDNYGGEQVNLQTIDWEKAPPSISTGGICRNNMYRH